MASYQLPLPVPLSYGQTTSAPPVTAISNRPTSVTPAPAPGVKRARGPTPAPALAASTVGEEDERAARRAVKGVPAAGSLKKSSSLGASSSEVRRSTRLSRETLSGGAGPATSSVALLSSASGKSRGQTINPREKKRSKSGAGLSVLSDGGSEIQSPRSPHSSSPVPSSPGATIHQVMDPAVHEAEDYIAQCMRCFAAAACYAAEYDSVGTLEALALLPAEQQKSWRCCVGVAKAHFELLNYDKVGLCAEEMMQNLLTFVPTGRESICLGKAKLAPPARVYGALFDALVASSSAHCPFISCSRSRLYLAQFSGSVDRIRQRLFAARRSPCGSQVFPARCPAGCELCICVYVEWSRMCGAGGMGESPVVFPTGGKARWPSLQCLVSLPNLIATI